MSLSDPIDCCLPGSSVHGIFQARVLEWGAIAFSERITRRARNRPCIFMYPQGTITWNLLISNKYLFLS